MLGFREGKGEEFLDMEEIEVEDLLFLLRGVDGEKGSRI